VPLDSPFYSQGNGIIHRYRPKKPKISPVPPKKPKKANNGGTPPAH